MTDFRFSASKVKNDAIAQLSDQLVSLSPR